jgi:large subunit ribosomal protein L23
MKLTDVIRRPLITEKTSILREDGRTIVFQVATGANKVEIKRAVEQLLGSKVENIRTSIAHGEDQAPGAICRPPLGLEEGLREAARRREDAGVLRRSVVGKWLSW